MSVDNNSTTAAAVPAPENIEARLYVGNLALGVRHEDLSGLFGQFGPLKIVDIMPSGKYAFVEFENSDDANAAVDQLREYELHGKTLLVYYANPRRQPRGSSGQQHNQSNQQRNKPPSFQNGQPVRKRRVDTYIPNRDRGGAGAPYEPPRRHSTDYQDNGDHVSDHYSGPSDYYYSSPPLVPQRQTYHQQRKNNNYNDVQQYQSARPQQKYHQYQPRAYANHHESRNDDDDYYASEPSGQGHYVPGQQYQNNDYTWSGVGPARHQRRRWRPRNSNHTHRQQQHPGQGTPRFRQKQQHYQDAPGHYPEIEA